MQPEVACGTCYNCYMEVKTNGLLDPKICQLAQLAHSLNYDFTVNDESKLQCCVNVSRLSAKDEKEARKKKRFRRVVTPQTELNLHCRACYDAGWRPSFGRTFGNTVFYFSIEEKTNTTAFPAIINAIESETSYEMRFKAITYRPMCRICRTDCSLKTNFDEDTISHLVTTLVKRVIKFIALRENKLSKTQSTVDDDGDKSQDSLIITT